MAIKIVKEKQPKKKIDPYYVLKYEYMIGDADGYTSEKTEISADNPFIERYVKLLNKLKPTKGTWGLVFGYGILYKCYEEGQITLDDYNFLMRLAYSESLEEEEDDDAINYFKTEEENNWADEFGEGIRSETEYSFLVFQGIELKYVDEDGKKHKTKFVDETE